MISDLETPAVLVDRERLLVNLEAAREIAVRHEVALRPHVKTHKCPEIAQLQLAHGAVGLTASKVDEALTFFESGARSITVAYPLIDERKAHRLFAAGAAANIEFRAVVDHSLGVELLARTARERGVAVNVFIDVDVGLRRCGLREDDPRLPVLAHAICDSSHLKFAGLFSHAGHAYAAKNADEICVIAAEECAILNRVRERLEGGGIEVKEVSVGSTPTVLASRSFDGITEIRPGNYVFLDRTALRLGLVPLTRVALLVLTTVVSANQDYFIIDAGSKVLSSDAGAHGTGGAVGFGCAFPIDDFANADTTTPLEIVRLSEEHGFVRRAGMDLPVGTKLRVVPNHACPVANLARELVVISADEEVARWPVAARGLTR